MRTIVFILISVLWSSAPTLARPLTQADKEVLIEAISRRLDKSAFSTEHDFSDWPSKVESHHQVIDSSESTEAFEKAINETFQEYGISHLALFDPQTAQALKSGKRTGMGISIQKVEDGVFILQVIKDSPAWKAGLRKGDILQRIDGVLIEDIEQLAGDLGQQRMLSWKRNDQLIQHEIIYASFPVSEESSMNWIRDDVAFITVNSFQRGFYRWAAIDRFFRKSRNAKGIIIDLRGNRGGLSLFCRHLASKIAPRNYTYSLRLNKKRWSHLETKSPKTNTKTSAARRVKPFPFSRPYNGKVVILTDSLSASGGDLFPAFAAENDRALIIGEKTAGALQLARTFRLPKGFRLYLPIAEVYTPKGNELEGTGFSPNIKLGFQETANDSKVLEIALRYIDDVELSVQLSPLE